MKREKYQSCIDASNACAIMCEYCAGMCIEENNVELLGHCIVLDRECAAVCRAVANLMSVQGANAAVLCQTCVEICEKCAAECEKHSHMDHCRDCAMECKRCADECAAFVELKMEEE